MKTKLITSILSLLSVCVMAQTSKEKLASYPYKAEIKKIDAFEYLYYEYKGSYMNAFTAFPNLADFINEKNIETGNYSLGVYYDDPSEVPENDLRSEIGMMVKVKVKDTGIYKYKKVEGFKAATIKYTNITELQTAYAVLLDFMESKKLTPVGPAYEFYYTYDGNTIDAEIIFPVK